jgi:saccharopine dehydrogenase-like NADP-dependent oxidoreductase
MSAFATERERDIHVACAYLAQARSFRLRGSTFAVTLLDWAGNARRRAMLKQPEQVQHVLPIQQELFVCAAKPTAADCAASERCYR